jgi:hypothetical protein
MRNKQKTALFLLTSMPFFACSSKDSDDSTATSTEAATPLSLNILPSLDEAAGVEVAGLRLAPVGTAPNFTKIQEDYLTATAKAGLFGTTSDKQNFCFNVTRTARALSKFLSNDSNLCIFKEVENARKAEKSWISVTSGTVGDEGLFGQTSDDKKLKFSASMGEGTRDIYFDVKGSGGSSSADYELTMRQCQGTSLHSIQVVQIERATGKVTIRQNSFEDGGSPKDDVFTGYLKSDASGWDLATAREFMYDMFRKDSTPNTYESVWTQFTAAGQIVTMTIEGGNDRSIVAASVVGSTANTLSLQEAYFTDLSNNATGGMEFVTSAYVAADATELKALADALPTTGRYVEAQTAVALPLLDAADCTMESPDIEGTIDLGIGQPEFNAVCKSALTDSSSETDANGNPVLRSGAYCSSL